MKPTQLVAALLSYSALSAAWGLDGLTTPNALQNVKDVLWKRQDSNTDSASTTASATKAQSTSNSNSAKSTDASASGSSGSQSGSKGTASGSGSKTASGDSSKTSGDKSSATTEFDLRDPPGGISMVTPAPTAGATYYKVGDYVTFAWNYTSLQATPSAIDVFASCKANNVLYTLAVNMSVEPTGKVVWDTKAANSQQALLSETYTLIVMDAESSISATPKSGYLAVAKDFTFPMYVPQPYQNEANYECATCNGAFSLLERQTMLFTALGGTLFALSFTYFSSRFGIF